MQSLWWGNLGDSTHTTNTEFSLVTGRAGWNATENRRYQVCPSDGTVSKLKLVLETAPGSGNSFAFTLRVNEADSSLTVTISGSDTSGSDLSNQVSVSAGDTVSMQSVPTGGPTVGIAKFTMIFTGDVSNESVLMATNAGAALNASATEYDVVQHLTGLGPVATELDAQQLCAGAGTIKNLYVKMSASAGSDPDAYRFTLRKNGVSQSLTVTITATATTGNDTSNSFSVAAGDLLTLLIEPLNAPSASPHAAWGVTFVADTDGESLVMCGNSDDIHTSNTEHASVAGATGLQWGTGGGSEEANRTLLDTCVMRDLYVSLENAPGSGNSFTFSTRINPGIGYSAGNLAVTISDASTTGNDQSNSDSMNPGDSMVIRCTPSSLPTVGQAKWGMVIFIAVAATSGKGSLITRMEAAGFI